MVSSGVLFSEIPQTPKQIISPGHFGRGLFFCPALSHFCTLIHQGHFLQAFICLHVMKINFCNAKEWNQCATSAFSASHARQSPPDGGPWDSSAPAWQGPALLRGLAYFLSESALTRASPTMWSEAGFWPVMSSRSTTTWPWPTGACSTVPPAICSASAT